MVASEHQSSYYVYTGVFIVEYSTVSTAPSVPLIMQWKRKTDKEVLVQVGAYEKLPNHMWEYGNRSVGRTLTPIIHRPFCSAGGSSVLLFPFPLRASFTTTLNQQIPKIQNINENRSFFPLRLL